MKHTSVFYQLFDPEEAAVLTFRAKLLSAVSRKVRLMGSEPDTFGIAEDVRARILAEDINSFTTDDLVVLAAQLGLPAEV